MNFLKIRPNEKRPILILFIIFFCITGACITGAAVRDAIFLINFDRTYLPLMYILIALFMALAIEAYKKLTSNKDQINLMIIAGSFFSMSLLVFQLHMAGWVIPAFYIWMEIITILSIMQFWILAGEVFNPRQAKRLFPLIIAGGSIAAIGAGYSIKPFVQIYGSENLLYLTIIFLITSIIMSHFVRPYIKVDTQEIDQNIQDNKVQFDPYLKAIAIMVACSAFISRTIDYQFKIISSEAFPNQNDLVDFFGTYYMYTGIATLIMQFFVTSFILTRFGILIGLIILPITLSFGSTGFLLVGSLLTVFITKFSDQVFKFSINNAIKEILWLPLSIKKRQRSKPIIDGTLKSVVEGFAGLVIFLLVYLNLITDSNIYLLSIIVLAVTAIWIWDAIKLKEGYVSEIVRSIDNRQLNLDEVQFDVHDAQTVETLDKVLNEKDEFKQLFALDLLWTLPLDPWKNSIKNLFLGGSPAIQRGVLELSWNQQNILPDKMIQDQIIKQDSVSPYAIACASDRNIKGLGTMLKGYLNHESTALSTASAIALLADNPDHKESKQLIEKNFQSGDQNTIYEMLGFLRTSPDLVSHDQILSCLKTNNNDINNSVLTIISENQNLDYFDHVIKLLARPSTAINAEKALLSYPKDKAHHRLLNVMSDKKSGQSIRRAILRIMHNYDKKDTVEMILSCIDNPDLSIIDEASNALIKISKSRNLENSELKKVDNNIQTLAKRAYQLHSFKHDISKNTRADLVIDHIENDLILITRIILKLGTLKDPNVPIETYIRYIESGDMELIPLVLELVESTFSSNTIKILIPLIDPESDPLSFANEFFNQGFSSKDEMLIYWIENPHQWKTSIATQYLLKNENTAVLKRVKWDKIPEHLLDTKLFTNSERDYLNRNFLHKNLSSQESQTMYSILEKTLLLKSVDLFQTIPGDILSKIAQISVEIETGQNDSIFMEGEQGDSLFVIISGKINVTQDNKSIAILEGGHCIGEMALLDQEPRSAGATAIEDSILLKIDQEGFYELMASNPDIMRQIVRMLTKRVRDMNKKLTTVLS